MMTRKILLAALAIAGVSFTILPDQAFALDGALNGVNLGNGIIFGNGVAAANGPASNGTYHDGLSLEGVILPELAE